MLCLKLNASSARILLLLDVFNVVHLLCVWNVVFYMMEIWILPSSWSLEGICLFVLPMCFVQDNCSVPVKLPPVCFHTRTHTCKTENRCQVILLRIEGNYNVWGICLHQCNNLLNLLYSSEYQIPVKFRNWLGVGQHHTHNKVLPKIFYWNIVIITHVFDNGSEILNHTIADKN